jgi:predicted lipoprotein with Yx(FWY)xxD motif
MSRLIKLVRVRGPRSLATLAAGTAGVALALLAGMAVARTFTLQVAKNATVRNPMTGVTKHENIVVDARRRAVYTLSGDSKSHPKCTKANHCFIFWPPVKVSSARKLSKAPGIKGKLGVWHRNGFNQVTLGGHPLYEYSGDSHKNTATGEGIQTFGGTWHVVKASAPASTMPPASSGTTTTTPPYTPPYSNPPGY